MKEPSIEEKARRYDEAIERAKKVLLDCTSEERKVVEYISPELAKSDGERIRKALLEMVHDTTGDSLWVDYNVHKDDCLAWLEKQGEQYHAWSKEDDYVVKELGGILYNAYGISDDERETCTNWLKSIEGRVQPKLMEVWSGKDEDKFNKVIDELTPFGECPDNPDWEERVYYHGRDAMIKWLKSLRTRLGGSEHDNVTSKTTNVSNSSITVEGMYNPTKDASV